MPPFVKIALRSFKRHRLRNFLTVLVISAAVALVIGANIAFESASAQYQQTMHVASGYIDIVVRPSDEGSTINTSFIDTVRKVEGVSAAFGRISVEATVTAWSETHTVSRHVYIIGVSDEDFAYNDPSFTNITGIRRLGSLGIVLDSRLDGKIGYSAVIDSNYRYLFNVVGISTPGIFGEISIEKKYYCFINLTTAQEFFGMEDEVNYIIVKVSDPARVSEVAERIRQQLPFLVVFTVRRNVTTIATQYAANFQRMLQLLSYLPIAIAFVVCFNSSYMNVLERKREIGIMQALGARRRQIFWVLLSESLFTGILGVLIGLVLSIGVALVFFGHFTQLFQLREATLTFPSSTFILDAAYLNLPNPTLILYGLTVGLTSTILGSSIPVFIASRSTAVKNLHPRAVPEPKKVWFIFLLVLGCLFTFCGLLVTPKYGFFMVKGIDMLSIFLIAIGLVLIATVMLSPISIIFRYIAYPLTRRLSVISMKNIIKNPGRSTIVFSLIAICLGFIVIVGGMEGIATTNAEKLVRNFFPSDLVVSTRDGVPLESLSLWKNLEGGSLLNQVEPAMFTTRTVYNPAKWKDWQGGVSVTTRIMAVNPKTFFSIVNVSLTPDNPGIPATLLAEKRACILTQSLANALQLKNGQTIGVLVTEEAIDATGAVVEIEVLHKLRISGIISDMNLPYIWLGGRPLDDVIITSYDSLTDIFKHSVEGEEFNYANFIFIQVKPNQKNNLGNVKQAIISAYGEKYNLNVYTKEDLVAQMRADINNIVAVFQMCLAFSLTIAAFGIGLVMMANVSERRQEVYALRAMGASRWQVGLSLILEAVTLGIVGFIVGIAIGIAFWGFFNPTLASYKLLAAPPIPPHVFINSLAVAITMSVIGASYPAYTASNIPPPPKGVALLEMKMPKPEVEIEIKLSPELSNLIKNLDKDPSIVTIRVPDRLVPVVASLLLKISPTGNRIIEINASKAEEEAEKLTNCVVILHSDSTIAKLRHVPKLFSLIPGNYFRIVIVPESTFQYLAPESQNLIKWVMSVYVEGKPKETS